MSNSQSINCLIIDPMHPSITTLLEGIGVKPDYRPDIKPSEVVEIIHRYEGLIVRSKMFLGRELLEQASKLRFIARAGAGVDLIDVQEVEKRNIQLLNAPEGNRDALAEHCIGMLLALLNNFIKADAEVRNGTWDREGNRGFEIMNKTIALIGYGFMGKAVAARLRGFGCKILVYDIDPTIQYDEYVEKSDMERIRRETDILSFHIPLDENSRQMVDYSYLNSFQKNIFLVNTARGEIMSLKALNQLLDEKKIIAAALDVLENEKISKLAGEEKENFDNLKARKNVILTPHVGGWTFESYVRINEILVSKIKDSGLLA